jgi:hypothetical protein
LNRRKQRDRSTDPLPLLSPFPPVQDPSPDANTVKDVEYGRNTELPNLEAIAKALGLKLELVEA